MTPATLLGVASCGVFLKKFPLAVRGFARLAVITTSGAIVTGSFLLATGCNSSPIAGLSVGYHNTLEGIQPIPQPLPNLTATCNADCSCESSNYNPVCGGDGITYVTPCHAGCREQHVLHDDVGHGYKFYADCSCIQPYEDVDVTTPSTPPLDYALDGQCDDDCDMLVLFAVLYAIVIFINSWFKNPAIMLILRVVHEDDRTIALGFNSVCMKLLGFLPAPIYFGVAIESTCVLWNKSCGQTGDCLLYDLTKFRYVFIGLFLALKCVSLTGFSIVAILAEKAHAKEMKRFKALPTSDDANQADVNMNKRNRSVKDKSEV
ncbi:solute carrier organic anion transporter family member 5A1-like [Amphiura filiformis]|uniref:solute carrier organic anion transporter family member 5A1-like n=1 Tax=Amphiura filiformis TaxID=82378 RepID=UPI003B222788